METLAPEIKIEILRLVPDVRTLGALVHASPSYHATYQTVRAEILALTTLKTLRRRGVHISTPCCFAQVTLRHTKYHPLNQPERFFPYKAPAKAVIQKEKAVVKQVEKLLPRLWTEFGVKEPNVKLSVEDCIALLQIVRYNYCPELCRDKSRKRAFALQWVDHWQSWFQWIVDAARTHALQPKEIMFQHLLVFEDLVLDERDLIESFYERRQAMLWKELRDLAIYGRDKYIN